MTTPTAMVAPRSPSSVEHSPLEHAKQTARENALRIRALCDPAWGAQLGAHLLCDCPPPPGAIVAGFWPLPGEIDIRPLLRALIAGGNRVALPVTPKRGNPLTFRLWRPDDALIPERFGTMRPVGEACTPDILLVPLLAFDRRGYRLGYGGGFYDRTLAELPQARAIGCGFAAQELDEVPIGPYDVPLAAIATERGVILCESRPR